MTAKFIIFRDKANKFRFRLKAPNSEIIAVGEAYESKESCLNGIRSIQKNALAAAVEDLTLGLPREPRAVKEAASPEREIPPRKAAPLEAAVPDTAWRPEPVPGGFMRCNCVSCRSRITR